MVRCIVEPEIEGGHAGGPKGDGVIRVGGGPITGVIGGGGPAGDDKNVGCWGGGGAIGVKVVCCC